MSLFCFKLFVMSFILSSLYFTLLFLGLCMSQHCRHLRMAGLLFKRHSTLPGQYLQVIRWHNNLFAQRRKTVTEVLVKWHVHSYKEIIFETLGSWIHASLFYRTRETFHLLNQTWVPLSKQNVNTTAFLVFFQDVREIICLVIIHKLHHASRGGGCHFCDAMYEGLSKTVICRLIPLPR